MAISITETTMVDVGDLRVGVGGIRTTTYTTAAGVEQRGPTAILTIADAGGGELFDERVHPGQQVRIGDSTWVVESVNNPQGALGSVTLAKVTP
jgi:hypothetical protein